VALRQAEAFLAARGVGLVDASRADLEAFLGDLLTYRAASTAATYYKVLRILYRWLDEEDEIDRDPTAKMKRPIVPEQPIPVVPGDSLRRLLATCAGKSFEDRRDTALILLLVDVGPRRAELMGLKVSDVDFDLDVLLVLGKGRRERALPFGRKSAVALDRYLRVRSRHKDAGLPWLWLGLQGRLTDSGRAATPSGPRRLPGALASGPGMPERPCAGRGGGAGGRRHPPPGMLAIQQARWPARRRH
jgi:site-specific recombinase XerD